MAGLTDLDRAKAGPHVVVTITGRAGARVPRILAELQAALTAAGVPVLFARVSDLRAVEDERWAASQGGSPDAAAPVVILGEGDAVR